MAMEMKTKNVLLPFAKSTTKNLALRHLDEKQLRQIEYLCREYKKWTIRKDCFVFSIFFVLILSFVSHLFYEKMLRAFCLLIFLLAYCLYEFYEMRDLHQRQLREIKHLCSGVKKINDTKAMFVFSMLFSVDNVFSFSSSLQKDAVFCLLILL